MKALYLLGPLHVIPNIGYMCTRGYKKGLLSSRSELGAGPFEALGGVCAGGGIFHGAFGLSAMFFSASMEA
jgi:hypothetical protein